LFVFLARTCGTVDLCFINSIHEFVVGPLVYPRNNFVI